MPVTIAMKIHSLACVFLKNYVNVCSWKFPHKFLTLQHLHFPRPFYSLATFTNWLWTILSFDFPLSRCALIFFLSFINITRIDRIHEMKNISSERLCKYNFYVYIRNFQNKVSICEIKRVTHAKKEKLNLKI